MKGYLVIGLLIVFFLGVVSASEPPQPMTCSDSNQTILRLESYYNAHAEVWNGTTNYPYEICFNSFFSNNWTGANPHSCTGDNLVLNLSDLTDASADGPGTSGGFRVPVCYGDLNCELRRSIDSCGNFGSKQGASILSISAQTNGHLAKGGRYESTTEDLVLCCESAIPSICLKDKYCDTENGETAENCVDCVDGPICDLDGNRAGHEECDCGLGGGTEGEAGCDSIQFGGLGCADLTQPDWVGLLRCDDSCKIDTALCQSPSEDPFCIDLDYVTAFTIYTGTGETPGCSPGASCRVKRCEDINHIDLPPGGYGPGLDAFKEKACNDCSVRYDWAEDPLASTSWCEWNATAAKCESRGTYANDVVCATEWVDGGTCGPDDLTRTINITYRKISGPPDKFCPPDKIGVTVDCATVIQLPFLSTEGIVAIIILIALIYFIYLNKNKRK